MPSGTKVSASELSALVFAASFWNLRQAGALTMQPVTKKALGMFKVQHVELAMGPTVVQKSGYEDVIMRGVASGQTLAHDVVHAWFGRDSRDPEGDVLAVAKQEMVRFGLARQVDAGRGAVGGFLLGKTTIEPDLPATLVDTCSKAIKMRQESDDDRDF